MFGVDAGEESVRPSKSNGSDLVLESVVRGRRIAVVNEARERTCATDAPGAAHSAMIWAFSAARHLQLPTAVIPMG